MWGGSGRRGVCIIRASLVPQLVKDPPAVRETWLRSLGGEAPWEKGLLPTPVFWAGESHGPQLTGHKEADTTEQPSRHSHG